LNQIRFYRLIESTLVPLAMPRSCSLRTDASCKLQLRAAIIGKHRVRAAIRSCISRRNASTVLQVYNHRISWAVNPPRIAGHNCDSRRLLFAGIRSRIFLREINNSSPAPTRPSKFVRDAITRAALRRRYVSAQTRICRRGDGIRRDRRRGEERSRAGNTSDHPGNRPG